MLYIAFNYICSYIYINNQVTTEMAIDNVKKDGRGKPLVGNSGITRWKRRYEAGGQHEKVVNGVHYRDRVKTGVR